MEVAEALFAGDQTAGLKFRKVQPGSGQRSDFSLASSSATRVRQWRSAAVASNTGVSRNTPLCLAG